MADNGWEDVVPTAPVTINKPQATATSDGWEDVGSDWADIPGPVQAQNTAPTSGTFEGRSSGNPAFDFGSASMQNLINGNPLPGILEEYKRAPGLTTRGLVNSVPGVNKVIQAIPPLL